MSYWCHAEPPALVLPGMNDDGCFWFKKRFLCEAFSFVCECVDVISELCEVLFLEKNTSIKCVCASGECHIGTMKHHQPGSFSKRTNRCDEFS